MGAVVPIQIIPMSKHTNDTEMRMTPEIRHRVSQGGRKIERLKALRELVCQSNMVRHISGSSRVLESKLKTNDSG